MNAITELRQIGFSIWLDAGKIRYKQQRDNVDQDKVSSLLAEIKSHKGEAIHYLFEGQLMSMYQTKLDSTASSYQAGGLDWLKSHQPGVYAAIEQTESKLNSIWESTLQCQGSIKDFEVALTGWYRAQHRGIELFKNKKG